MITLPHVTIIGTVTADPELRYIQSGAAVTNFTVASNERRKNKDTGDWEDGDATFLRCNIWRDHAENVAETLTKGQRVIVVGKLKQRSYEKDDQKRTVFEIDVEEVGPALKWATAKVNKVNRHAESRGSREQQPPIDDQPPF